MQHSKNNYLLLCLILMIFSSCGDESVTTATYSLNVSVSPLEGGNITGASGEYQEGETVTITALPKEDWLFENWSGAVETTSNPLTITMNSDKAITANFAKITYSLNITILGEGTVAENIVQQKMTDYELGTVVELTPEPSSGWRFIEWRGDLTGEESPVQIMMDGVKDITAVFDVSNIYLGNNGVTVMCPNAEVGEIGFINNVQYEVVDDDLLRLRKSQGRELSQLCVSQVTSMNGLFEGTQFNQRIDNWDVSSVTDMGNMFRGSPFNQDIGIWDVGSVIQMNNMFEESEFNQPIGQWDVSSVEDMSVMFKDSPFNRDVNSWDVSSVTSMRSMFSYEGTDPVFNQPIGNWNVSNVTDMSYMFFNNIFFNQPIEDWDVSSVTDMSGMFWAEEGSFNQPIGNWDVSSVTAMRKMFSANGFNQPIGDWDVSNVTNMEEMFWYSQFNQPIGNWDVSMVTNMDGMFQNSPFNQPINGWCVDQFTSGEPSFFSVGSPLTEENKPVWGSCPVN